MDFKITTESDRARLMGHIAGLDLAKPYKISVTQIRSKRSESQNNLLWLWNGLIQAHLRDSFGQIASSEEIHEIMVSKLWPAEVHRIELPDGSSYKVGRAKTKKFSIQQMTEYLERLDSYCAEYLQLLLPHPSDLMNSIYGDRRPS